MRATLIDTQRPLAVFERGNRVQHHRPGDCHPHLQRHVTQRPLGVGVHRYGIEPPSGDRRQAAYYIKLLTLTLHRIDYRIEKCRLAINFSQAAGDVENFIGFRRLLRAEQEERRTVEELIAKLQRRFSAQIAVSDGDSIP